MRRFLQRFLNVFRGNRSEAEAAREIAAHLALLEDDYQRRGMTADEARLAARRALGSTAGSTMPAAMWRTAFARCAGRRASPQSR
jgi:hypothetical protein